MKVSIDIVFMHYSSRLLRAIQIKMCRNTHRFPYCIEKASGNVCKDRSYCSDVDETVTLITKVEILYQTMHFAIVI